MRGIIRDAQGWQNLFRGAFKELLHPPASQIPFLDGLRSAAILLVVSGHLSKVFSDTYGPTLYSRLPFVANGWIGVDLFFVLSGFFIGGQLWKEVRRDRTIDVRRFILRRGFRIWPLYFFVYICVLTFSLIHGGAAAKQYGWSDLVFVTNLYNHGLVEGSWSLCTEEQFYIVAPVALLFFAERSGAIERCRVWLWGLLVTLPVFRALLWVHATGHIFRHDPTQFPPIYYSSITHCDGLIMGLLIANAWTLKDRPKSKFGNPWLLLAGGFGVLVLAQVVQKEILDFTGLACLFGAVAWLGLQRKIRVFNSRVFYWISRLSFGMYLNHEYLTPWVVNSLLPRMPLSQWRLGSNLLGVAILAVLSAGVALVTFCLVEHPLLQLRSIVLSKTKPAPVPADATVPA